MFGLAKESELAQVSRREGQAARHDAGGQVLAVGVSRSKVFLDNSAFLCYNNNDYDWSGYEFQVSPPRRKDSVGRFPGPE